MGNFAYMFIEGGEKMQAKRPKAKEIKPKEDPIYVCMGTCAQQKKKREFYKSNNKAYPQGIIPWCKDCVKQFVYNGERAASEEKMKEWLKLVDMPFIKDKWESACNSPNETVGRYLALIGFNIVTRDLKWKDSDFEGTMAGKLNPVQSEIQPVADGKPTPKRPKKIKITDDIIELFGDGYSEEEYQMFWKKYDILKDNYPQQTAMHTEALVNYVRYRVKEERATAMGDVNDAKSWGALANTAAVNAKINPNQMSKADLQGGISTIGEIALAVEQAKDVIPILPRFKFRPNDAVDFLIWEYINYERRLSGMPLVDYSDIYKFYDERVKQFVDNGGDPKLFENDPTVENRERVKKFISVPKEDSE